MDDKWHLHRFLFFCFVLQHYHSRYLSLYLWLQFGIYFETFFINIEAMPCLSLLKPDTLFFHLRIDKTERAVN
jgi:hypothetical protein